MIIFFGPLSMVELECIAGVIKEPWLEPPLPPRFSLAITLIFFTVTTPAEAFGPLILYWFGVPV
jgi:hypothetical protein